jgi:hypothetical protein
MSKDLIAKDTKHLDDNPLKKTFNRLKKKVERLEKECQECTKTLDRHLDFYGEMLFPKERLISVCLKKEIKGFSHFLKDKKRLKKPERSILKHFIADIFEKLSLMEGADMVLDEELSKIFKETVGFSYQDELDRSFEEFKKNTEKMFAEKGIDLDLSSLKVEGSQEDTLLKMMEYMSQYGDFPEQEDLPPPNSKETQKAKATEDLQKKEVSTIYKQLAKVFHPDLETNPILKLEKEVFMKKLTSAYEAQDLHTLLSLELEAFNLEESNKKVHSEAQLKTYNQLLQTQVRDLQQKLKMIPNDPKYTPLSDFTLYKWKKGDFALQQINTQLENELNIHQKIVDECESGNAFNVMKAMLTRYIIETAENHRTTDLDLF